MDMKITIHECGYEPDIDCTWRHLIGHERVFHVFANSSWGYKPVRAENCIINICNMCIETERFGTVPDGYVAVI